MATETQTTYFPAAPASAPGLPANPRRWWALAATSFGLFMTLLDTTIVNVALPTIGTDLHASFSDLQWVINAYVLALAVFLVTAGRLGDLFGRKRLFMVGLALFSLGSLGCALARSVPVGPVAPIQVLIAARAFQGLGGAIMLPLALAIIAATFQGRERGTAFGINGGVTGLATALGPVAGGLLVAHVSWQSIFYLNVPIGLIGIALCAWSVTESSDSHAPRRIDFYGLVTLTISLCCLVLALMQGNDADKGWTSPSILTLFGGAVLALIAFVGGELRLAHPMVDPRLFLHRSFTGAAVIAFTLSAGLYALFFFLTLYLQNFLGFSALDAGVRFLPMSGLVLIVAPLAGAFGHRLGARVLLGIGMALLVAGVFLMGGIAPQDTPDRWIVLLPAFILAGVGSGLVNPEIAGVAVNSVSRDRAGMASGISGVCRQLGTAFGIAFLGAVLTTHYNSGLQDRLATLPLPGVPPAQVASVRQSMITGLQQAGPFVGSTGLKHPPPQFAAYAAQPIFPQIQAAVRESFIDGTVLSFRLACLLLLIGLLAAVVLVRPEAAQPAAWPRGNPPPVAGGDPAHSWADAQSPE